MFYNYKVVNNILYLYINDKCEIGSLFDYTKNSSVIDKIKDYIKIHKIKFNGTKVVLLLSGIMLGTVYLNNDKNINYNIYKDNKYVYNIVDKSVPEIIVQGKIDKIVEEALSDISYDKDIKNVSEAKINSNSVNVDTRNLKSASNNNDNDVNNSVEKDRVIILNRTNKEVLQLNLEEYLIGVVAAEMPATFNIEAIKAQAVVARTYTLKLLESGRSITDDVSVQTYKSNSELQSMWGSSYNAYYNKIKNAVSSTNGLCIKYNGSLIDAVYHSTSNGYTEDSVNVWKNSIPYLKTVTSPWDTSASTYLKREMIEFDRISKILGIDFNASSLMEIVSRDDSNRVSKIRINDKEYTGVYIRNMLGLRSADFDFYSLDNGIMFTTRGYGHGVGMSQYGANGMANSGYTFEQIIKHYYTNVEIEKI